MELLDKLKLNSPVVKIGDDYNATFPKKNGTIALTSDIPDSYTKDESDEKFVKFGENACQTSTSFIDFDVGEALIKVGCTENSYTLIKGPLINTCTIQAKNVYTNDFSVKQLGANSLHVGIPGCAFVVKEGETYFGEQKVTIDTDAEVLGDFHLKIENYADVKLSVSCGETPDDSFLCFSNKNNTVELPLDKSGTIALTSDIPDVSRYITKEVNDLTNYEKRSDAEKKYAQKSDISKVYKYVGSVENYSDLPTSNLVEGHVYNIVNECTAENISCGDNVAWTGSSWDKLGGSVDLSNYVENGNTGTQYWIPNAVLGAESGCNYGAKIRINRNTNAVEFLTNTTGLAGECIVMSIECGLDHVCFHALPEMCYCCTGNILIPTKDTQFTTKSYVDAEVGKKATKSTSLSGYGITDAYTKTEGDKKYVGFGHNVCGVNFIDIDIGEKSADITVGGNDLCTVINGCGVYSNNVDANVVRAECAFLGGCSLIVDSTCIQFGEPIYLTNSCSRIKIDPIPKDSSLENSYLGFSNNEVLVELPLNKDGTIALTSDIPDSYTKEETDGKYVKLVAPEAQTISGCLSLDYLGDVLTLRGDVIFKKTNGETTSFKLPSKNSNETQIIATISDITCKANKSTTLAGYGITDAYTKTESDAKYLHLLDNYEVCGLDDYGEIHFSSYSGGSVKLVPNYPLISISGVDKTYAHYTNSGIIYSGCNISFPSKAGTIALTSDVPDSYTKAESDANYYRTSDNIIITGACGILVEDGGSNRFGINHNGEVSTACGVFFGPVENAHGSLVYSNLLGFFEFSNKVKIPSSVTINEDTDLTTKKYVDDSICTSTQHLKTKSYQSVETTGDKWTITLDSEYSSAPFFQVFNSENSVVYPEVKFTAPSTLELTFEGKEGIGLGEFTAVVSVPFTTTITPNESYVSIGTAQGISGKKNFTTVPTINSVDIATVDNLSTTENSIRSYVDTEISAKVASVYRFKGDSAYASLPANAQVGDVYNLTTASGEYKIGDNVAWTGSKWDKLAATVDLSGYLTTSSASSTYLTISSANSTYATIGDTLRTSCAGTQYMSGTLCLNNPYACLSAPSLFASDGIYVGIPDSENDTSYFYGPVEFNDTVSVSELEIDSLTLETLEIGNEINVKGIAVSESISKLNAKTGSLEYVLPAKDPSSGVVEWEVTINTDLTKTVKCPPNVIVCDITGERYKYVVCDVEWDGANKIYIKFDNDDPIEDNQFKAYITNIQLQ